MRLALCTGVIGRNDMTKRWLENSYANCTGDVEVVIVANGSTPEEFEELKTFAPEDAKLAYFDKPLGISLAFNTAVSMTDCEAVAVLQSDCLVYEKGWDEKILGWLQTLPNAGLIGFAGGRALGAEALYQRQYSPYLLGRSTVYSSLVDWEHHGHECVEPISVAVLDGLAMCFLKDRWESWGGFDTRFFHHCYDLDVCTAAHNAGFNNFVVPIRCQHISGQSVGTQPYADVTASMGGDIGVWAESHEKMYWKWYPNGLPTRARDV